MNVLSIMAAIATLIVSLMAALLIWALLIIAGRNDE